MSGKGITSLSRSRSKKHEDEYTVPKKIAATRWSSDRQTDVGKGKLKVQDRYGALTVEEEDCHEESYGCQPCGWNADSVFAGRG